MTGAGTQFDQTDIAHNTTSQRVTLNPSHIKYTTRTSYK